MTEAEIRALIAKKGATMTDIAAETEVSLSTVRKVIRGEARSRRIANVIALFLGRRIEDLWPGAYPEQYRRKTAEQVRREVRAAVMAIGRVLNER